MGWCGKKVKVVKAKPDESADQGQEELARALEKLGFQNVKPVCITLPDGRVIRTGVTVGKGGEEY